jgi:hypothetical protein
MEKLSRTDVHPSHAKATPNFSPRGVCRGRLPPPEQQIAHESNSQDGEEKERGGSDRREWP